MAAVQDPNQPDSNTLIIGFAGPSGVGKSYMADWLFKWLKHNYQELNVLKVTDLTEIKTWDPTLDVVIVEHCRPLLYNEDGKFVFKHRGMVIRVYNDESKNYKSLEDNVFIHNDMKSCYFSDDLTNAFKSHRKWFVHTINQ